MFSASSAAAASSSTRQPRLCLTLLLQGDDGSNERRASELAELCSELGAEMAATRTIALPQELEAVELVETTTKTMTASGAGGAAKASERAADFVLLFLPSSEMLAGKEEATKRWWLAIQTLCRKKVTCFVCIFAPDADSFPLVRSICTIELGVHMFSPDMAAIKQALTLVLRQGSRAVAGKTVTCPICGLAGLSEEDFWTHCPLYHIKIADGATVDCPICRKNINPRTQTFQKHLHKAHSPKAALADSDSSRKGNELYAFSLVYCVRSDGRVLLVHERGSVGYWLPGGGVESGETLSAAALRETREEVGAAIRLTGILRLEYAPGNGYVRMRAIFLAAPLDESAPIKSLPDYESAGASWVDPALIMSDKRGRCVLPLRAPEPAEIAAYLAGGGMVHPLSLLEES